MAAREIGTVTETAPPDDDEELEEEVDEEVDDDELDIEEEEDDDAGSPPEPPMLQADMRAAHAHASMPAMIPGARRRSSLRSVFAEQAALAS
jgi:hypothetical protein